MRKPITAKAVVDWITEAGTLIIFVSFMVWMGASAIL